jgi:hypothetical protein
MNIFVVFINQNLLTWLIKFLMIAQHVEHVLTNALWKLFPKATFIKSILKYAPTAAHVLMYARWKLFTRNNFYIIFAKKNPSLTGRVFFYRSLKYSEFVIFVILILFNKIIL